jgi:hypothetical protein
VSRRTAASLSATARRRHGRLIVRGTLHRAATGRVTITCRAKLDSRWRTRNARVRIRDGRFTARLDLPSRWRTAPRIELTLRYGGNHAVRPHTRALTVPR